MLDAACPGEVFTSPVPDQMLLATQAVNGGAGVLHIVKNYTGDVLNFQMAAEMAEDDGIEVVPVVINDDVAVEDSLYTAGRRGTGATVLVEKIAGARWPRRERTWPPSRRWPARSTSGAGPSASR
jgi:Dihydroxyacetone kinase